MKEVSCSPKSLAITKSVNSHRCCSRKMLVSSCHTYSYISHCGRGSPPSQGYNPSGAHDLNIFFASSEFSPLHLIETLLQHPLSRLQKYAYVLIECQGLDHDAVFADELTTQDQPRAKLHFSSRHCRVPKCRRRYLHTVICPEACAIFFLS